MRKINIAIDGPSAAGKSTISKKVAKELNYVHLDSGAMYRCVALKAKKENIQFQDEKELVSMLSSTKIQLTEDGKVLLDGEDVSSLIRTEEISMGASNISRFSEIRNILVNAQREMAKSKGYIMDGRDIGTVVLKDAEVKIFLTASVDARAIRRYKQDMESELEVNLETLKEEIEQRDYQDTHRAVSPLKKAEDAIEIDSSNLTIDEVVKRIINIVLNKVAEESI